MIKTIYRDLLGFSIRNSYYQNQQYSKPFDGVIREDFEIIPTKNTQIVMRQFGMIFCKKTCGFSVMAQVNETAPATYAVAKKIDKKTKLTFFLKLKNKAVLSFSEVGFKALNANKVYYFNNLSTNADARNDLRMSSQPTLNSTDDFVRLQTANYTYEHNSLVTASAAKIISLDNTDFVIAKNATQNAGKTILNFDLSSLNEGRYKLEIGGAKKDEFYFSVEPNLFGVVELYFDGTQSNYQILEPDFSLTPIRPKYNLNLQRRTTFWRYIINVNNQPAPLVLPEIKSSDTITTFSVVSNLPKQIIFKSDSSIDFTEVPPIHGTGGTTQFRKLTFKAGGIDKIANLPTPNPTIIKEESNQFYSEIIINI